MENVSIDVPACVLMDVYKGTCERAKGFNEKNRRHI